MCCSRQIGRPRVDSLGPVETSGGKPRPRYAGPRKGLMCVEDTSDTNQHEPAQVQAVFACFDCAQGVAEAGAEGPLATQGNKIEVWDYFGRQGGSGPPSLLTRTHYDHHMPCPDSTHSIRRWQGLSFPLRSPSVATQRWLQTSRMGTNLYFLCVARNCRSACPRKRMNDCWARAPKSGGAVWWDPHSSALMHCANVA